MEEKGLFRSALGGFHKQDVLEYIDTITAGWNEERVALIEQAETATATAEEASAAAKEAAAAYQQTADDLARLQKENAVLKERLSQLEGLPAQVASLTEELEETAARLETEQGASAALRESLATETERASTAVSEMMAAEQRLETVTNELETKNTVLVLLQEKVTNYEGLLGSAEETGSKLNEIVRPFAQQAYTAAEESLKSVEDTLAQWMLLMDEMRQNAAARRETLQNESQLCNQQLHETLLQWQEKAKTAAASTEKPDHFFR